MDGGATIAGQIERLIARLDGAAVCDDRVTERLGLSARSQANTVARGLGGQPGDERQKTPRVLCGATKTVIRRRQPSAANRRPSGTRSAQPRPAR